MIVPVKTIEWLPVSRLCASVATCMIFICMNGLITVREAARNCGGAENVNFLNNVKKARVVKEREELEAMRKREEEER